MRTRLHAMLLGGLVAATAALASPASPAAPGPAPAAAGGEQVDLQMPSIVAFEVTDVRAGPFKAREGFPVAFRGARLMAGHALRISLRLETAGALVAFEARNPRGGTCGDGHLSPGAFVRIFDAAAGATAGGCDLFWRLESIRPTRHAGTVAISLRWKVESIVVDPVAAQMAALLHPPASGTAVAAVPPPPARSGRAAIADGRPASMAPRPLGAPEGCRVHCGGPTALPARSASSRSDPSAPSPP